MGRALSVVDWAAGHAPRMVAGLLYLQNAYRLSVEAIVARCRVGALLICGVYPKMLNGDSEQ
jgi:hypothetical protein